MEVWLWSIIGIMGIVMAYLLVKIYDMRKSAKEMEEEFADRLRNDTNTLITISSQDKAMRKLANHLNEQLRKLRSERHRFQQGDLELKEAVTNISHDLRTPLTAICGYLDLLSQEEASQEVTRYLDIIKNRMELLKQLTEEFFQYSVFTYTSNHTAMEEVDLKYALEDSIAAYYAPLNEANIVPEISMSDQRILRRLNKKALSRILDNIINNAIKYSSVDLKITLCDNGEMIFSNRTTQLDEIQVGRLFDRYYTVETASNSTGLGLSIAKALTEQMNGKMSAFYHEGYLSIHLIFLL